MWIYEVMSWLALGLALAVGRYFLTEEPGHALRVFLGSATAAFLAGVTAHTAVTQSVVQYGDFSAISLLFAGLGSILFLVTEWLLSHRKPPRLRTH